MSNIALSIDLNTMRLTRPMLERIIYDLSCEFSLTCINLYNFVPLKMSDIGGIKHVNYIATTSTGRRKVMIDMSQVADLIELACNVHYDAIFVICGMLDSDAIFAKMSSLGKQVIIGTAIKLNLPHRQYIMSRQHNADINTSTYFTPNKSIDSHTVKPTDTQSTKRTAATSDTVNNSPNTTATIITASSSNADIASHETDIDNQLREIASLLQSLS